MNKKQLPYICPSCGQILKVNRLICSGCDTAVEGKFDLPVLSRLDSEEQTFIINLIKSSGSLKDLAGLYGVSYPTVRNRLDTLIQKIEELEDKKNMGEEV